MRVFIIFIIFILSVLLFPEYFFGQQNEVIHKRTIVHKTEDWVPGRIDDTRHVVDSFFYDNGILKEVAESIIERERFIVVDSIPVNSRKIWSKDGKLLLVEDFEQGEIVNIESHFPYNKNIIRNGSFEINRDIPMHKIHKQYCVLIRCNPVDSILETDTVYIQYNEKQIKKFILITKETTSGCKHDNFSRMVEKYLLVEKNGQITDSIFVRRPVFQHFGQPALHNSCHECNYDTITLNIDSWESLGQAFPNIFDYENSSPWHPLTGLADTVFSFNPLKGNNFVRLSSHQIYNVRCNPYMAHPLLQNSLFTTLDKGKKYYFEFWLWKPQVYPENKTLKIYFSQNPITINNYSSYSQVAFPIKAYHDSITHQWQKVSFTFEAPKFARYMTIGFFDFEKDSSPLSREPRNFGPKRRCYVDNFVLVEEAYKDEVLPKYHPLPMDELVVDISTGPVYPILFNGQKVEENKPVVLENIYFDFDSYNLLPKSIAGLQKLLTVMEKYADIHIEISGHTDDTGSEIYNLELSAKRARSVAQYLINQAVEPDRLTWKGYGCKQPIAGNDNEEGREQNRRVEFIYKNN